MNNLTRLRDYLAQLPDERVNMSRWLTGTNDPSHLLHHCDTAGCLAGWACVLFDPFTSRPVPLAATEALGLSVEVAGVLFTYRSWRCTRLQAIARLDFLITHPDATAQELQEFIDENAQQAPNLTEQT